MLCGVADMLGGTGGCDHAEYSTGASGLTQCHRCGEVVGMAHWLMAGPPLEPTPSPKRIQRKRTRGWRMPAHAIYVGRPSRWGNPYTMVVEGFGIQRSLDLYRETAQGHWNPSLIADMGNSLGAEVYRAHCDWLQRVRILRDGIRGELAGKDLACWCPLDQPCHADVLLELANA